MQVQSAIFEKANKNCLKNLHRGSNYCFSDDKILYIFMRAINYNCNMLLYTNKLIKSFNELVKLNGHNVCMSNDIVD